MLFHELDICQIVIFRLFTVYNKHIMIKIGYKPEKNRKYYRKCSNNFAADYTTSPTNVTMMLRRIANQITRYSIDLGEKNTHRRFTILLIVE